MSVVADFLIAPSIFAVIENFFNAGDLALLIFSKVTFIEAILASIFLALMITFHHKNKQAFALTLTVLCWVIAVFYVSYLIPKILNVTEVWKKAEEMGVVGIGDIKDAQQEHQFFHRIYIVLDSIKLIFLSTLIGLTVYRSQDKLS